MPITEKVQDGYRQRANFEQAITRTLIKPNLHVRETEKRKGPHKGNSYLRIN